MLDSDAAPQPGWIENLLKPFADPDIMAVAGFTFLGHDDFLSQTMALSWIFDLHDEGRKTVKRHKIHANNSAVRTDFFRENPFPDLPAFKKQCGFWLRDFTARGYRYARTAGAMTVHAPHPGFRFLAWRAWTMGLDRDYQAFQTATALAPRPDRPSPSVLRRQGRQVVVAHRTKGRQVDLPVWQRPGAMMITSAFMESASPARSRARSPAASSRCRPARLEPRGARLRLTQAAIGTAAARATAARQCAGPTACCA